MKDSDFWFPFMLVGMWALIIVIAAGMFFSIGYDLGRDSTQMEVVSNEVN